jgi:hypothetical protein
VKLLTKHQIAVFIGIGLVAASLLATRLVWGQSAPVLSISNTGTNSILITVTNGVSNGEYQLYWKEPLTPNSPWLFLTNGSIGQTQFVRPINQDLSVVFFRAVANTNYVPPSLNVIILSPTNGAVIY